MAEVVKKISNAATNLIGLPSANGKKYFHGNKKGEVFELKAQLNAKSSTKRKEAVKMVIANMTVGKDVSALFPDVLKCIVTDDLELKKLVYLYLMNYAHCQPDLVILAVNTFSKDCENENPIVRALAIRTMGSLKVERVLDYICDPLKRALHDCNAYVRKTAALCVPKIYDLSPQLADEFGFINELNELLKDSSQLVVTNSVCALYEIENKSNGKIKLLIDSSTLFQLLSTLNDCTEWGQVWILDALSNFTAANEEEALHILIHVCPRLNHVNSAVVMSSIRIMMQNARIVDEEHKHFYLKRIIAPFVSLLSSTYSSEIQFAALKSIKCTLHEFYWLFEDCFEMFFCKFSDSHWIRIEKMEILFLLCYKSNYLRILTEFVEYCQESNMQSNIHAIRYVGKIAQKIPEAMEECMLIMQEAVISTPSVLFRESCLVSIIDCLRKYPNWNSVALIEKIIELDFDMFNEDIACSYLWLVRRSIELNCVRESILFELLDDFSILSAEIQISLIETLVYYFVYSKKQLMKFKALLIIQQISSLNLPISCQQICKFWYFLLKKFSSEQILNIFDVCKKSIEHRDGQMVYAHFINDIAFLSSIVYKQIPTESTPSACNGKALSIENESVELVSNLLDLDLTITSPSRPIGTIVSNSKMQNLIDFISEDINSTPNDNCIEIIETDYFTLSCLLTKLSNSISFCLMGNSEIPLKAELSVFPNQLSLLPNSTQPIEFVIGDELILEFIYKERTRVESNLKFNEISLLLDVHAVDAKKEIVNNSHENDSTYKETIKIPIEFFLHPLDKIDNILFPYQQTIASFPSTSFLIQCGLFGTNSSEFYSWIPWLKLYVLIQYKSINNGRDTTSPLLEIENNIENEQCKDVPSASSFNPHALNEMVVFCGNEELLIILCEFLINHSHE